MKPAPIVVRWARVEAAGNAAAVSHRVALLAAAAAIGAPASSLALDHRCPRCGSHAHGQPFVVGRGVAVTLSRTPGAVIAAASAHPAVRGLGVDIEAASSSAGNLDSVMLSPTELAHPSRTPDGLSDLRTWVRKEAILKALGTGLAMDPRTVTLEGTTVTEGLGGPWWVHDLALADGLVASIAAVGIADADAVTAEVTTR